jgi:hypothetical protein
VNLLSRVAAVPEAARTMAETAAQSSAGLADTSSCFSAGNLRSCSTSSGTSDSERPVADKPRTVKASACVPVHRQLLYHSGARTKMHACK